MENTEKRRDFLYYVSLLDALQLNDGEWCVICPFGIGDTYFVCALAEQFLLYNGGSRFSVVVKPGQQEIPLLFPAISRIFVADSINLEAIRQFSSFTPGNLIIGHPRFYGDGLLELLCGHNGYTLLSLYYHIFRLPQGIPLSQPQVSPAFQEKAHTKFIQAGLPEGRTAVLAPHANSSLGLPLSYWQVLARCLQNMGWTVATNVSPQFPDPVPETQAVNFTLGEAIPFAEKAGWVIASRSGLCDLLATMKGKLSVLYLRQKWNEGTLLEGAGLRAMGLSRHADEIEVASEDDVAKTILRIISG